ncbi:ankyrin, partial [Neocallimastix californiae]
MVVKYLLNTDILYMEDVNYNNYHPLIKAIYQNQSDRVKALLSSESLNEINKDSTKFVICHFTPLILSYLLNNKEIFEILIKFFDINELDSFGYNLLYYAILKEDIKMINYLINNGIDINFMKSRSKGRYHSALDISILIKNKEIFNILINNEKILLNIPNKLGEIPLITILKYNDCNIIFKKEIIEQLLLKGANINLTFKHKNSPLIYSIQEKSLILTELLIQNGATINFIDDYGDTPLIYAVKENSYPIVKLLIENNANVNYTDEQGYTPLFYAVRSDSISLVKLLIENGADINNRKSIPIIESAFLNNSLSMIQLIMENGFDFTITYKIESILISYFNKVIKMNSDKEKNNMKSIFGFLSKYYLNIFTGKVIKEIIKYNKLIFLKILLDHNLDINIKDENGNTPLANAIKVKKREIVDYLIYKGASIDCINNDGVNIYDICLKYSNDYIGRIIFYKIK